MKSILKFALLSSTVLMFGVASATPPGMKPPSMGKRPVQSEGIPKSPNFWWPDQVDLTRLRQNTYTANPNPDFNYAEAFAKLDIKAVKADIANILTSSQDWWPADHGSYAGLFIRMAWHSAGTYRAGDGRGGSDGGQQRFEPLNSWPDNANLDKARRLLLPIKQKYGQNLSWSDLMILAGNVALEQGGLELAGFAGGRVDAWEPELVYWGPETKFLDSERFSKDRELEGDLAASQMGLIYVNPEGPDGNPDILASAHDIRTTFARMGMNDEDTVALIVGGHTIGKLHGATKAEGCVGPEPAAEGVEKQGFGWTSKCGTGKGPDTFTSGFEGIWTATPTAWSNNFVENLYNFEWEKTKSPAGVFQWIPKNVEDAKFIPDAFDPDKFHAPVMLTTDLAMRYDPAYGKITKRYLEEPGSMDKAFADAWYKLTHRDMGPKARYVEVEKASKENFIWQDPIPAVDYKPVNARNIDKLKSKIRDTGLSNAELVRAAWASAVTFRDTDYRGGANGARLRLAPQKDWDVNNPEELEKVINALQGIQDEFNSGLGRRKISMADLIVLGGAVAIEDAAKSAGHNVKVPFTPGRGDALQSQTDIASFELLRPAADGFRNYFSDRARLSPANMLIDRADMLTLSAPEMTVLIGGLRALDANAQNSKLGVLTERPGTLSNDFFKNLLDMSTEWTPAKDGVFEGRDRKTGKLKWTASEVDLMFGSNAELRAIAEYYGSDDGNEKFIKDFIKAWTKVMTLDRYDLK